VLLCVVMGMLLLLLMMMMMMKVLMMVLVVGSPTMSSSDFPSRCSCSVAHLARDLSSGVMVMRMMVVVVRWRCEKSKCR